MYIIISYIHIYGQGGEIRVIPPLVGDKEWELFVLGLCTLTWR